MKKPFYIFILLSLLFALVSCSNIKDLYKFSLDAPEVHIDGTTISWDEVENAWIYKIYNANTDELIDETTELYYTFSNFSDGLKVYVRACFDKEDFRYHDSDKSNVVEISHPVLDTPILEVQDNTISWEPVRYADYYEVYTYPNTKLATIESSENASSYQYTLSNNDEVKLLYVIACYSDIKFKDKNSEQSNIVSVAPDIISINISSLSGNYMVPNYISKITFTGQGTVSINVFDQKCDLEVVLNNFQTTGRFAIDPLSYKIKFTLIGDNRIGGASGIGLSCHDLSIYGDSSSSLVVYGGKGKDGANGRSYSSAGYDGTNGENGGNGFAAIYTENLVLHNAIITAIGGNGGDGGHGGTGGDGTTGKTVYNIFTGGKDGNNNYGGKGGNGGNGGNGGSPGPAIIGKVNTLGNSVLTKIDGEYGNGGNGGAGGDGGVGGNYYNAFGSVWRCRGGSGGNGGNGGNGKVPGNGGSAGQIGPYGNGSSMNGIGLGIDYGKVYYDDDNNPKVGKPGANGITLP